MKVIDFRGPSRIFKDITKIQGCSRIFKESGHHGVPENESVNERKRKFGAVLGRIKVSQDTLIVRATHQRPMTVPFVLF